MLTRADSLSLPRSWICYTTRACTVWVLFIKSGDTQFLSHFSVSPLIYSTSSCIMDIIKSVFTSAPVHSAAIQDTFVSIMYSISYTIYNIGPLRNGSSLGALLRLRGDCRGRRGMGSSTVSILCHILGTRIVPAGYTARRSANANCVRSILLDGSL